MPRRLGGTALVLLGVLATLPACGQERGADESKTDESKAVARVKKLQGTVDVDDSAPGKPVVGVSLVACTFTDDDLALLATFEKLQSLNLGLSSVTDTGLAQVKKLGKLETLELV